MMQLTKQFSHSDERGTFNELCRYGTWREFNFSTIKRGTVRGGHYHKNTEELIFVAAGKCAFWIFDLKKDTSCHFICDEDQGVIFQPYEVHWVKALKNAKIISLLSMPYDKNQPDTFQKYQGRRFTRSSFTGIV